MGILNLSTKKNWNWTKGLRFSLFVSGFLLAHQIIEAKTLHQDFAGFQASANRSSSSSETLDRMTKMEALRGGAQDSLVRLLKSKPGNLELEIRLAELIVQRGKDQEQFALELEINGETQRARELKNSSLKLLRQGLSSHSKLLARAKDHPMAPKIYLGMARTEYSLGQKGPSLNYAELGISRINNKNRSSLGDTELQLLLLRGDAAFDLAKATLALRSYTDASALAAKGSMELAYIHYKLAWTKYNLKDSESALGHLDELFKIASDKYALRQEAVQDFALFLADLPNDHVKDRGGFSGILSYLEKNSDRKSAEKAMTRLSGVYAKNGRRNDAISLNEFLISENPSAPENFERALMIVEWSHHLADKSKLTDRYYWVMDYFGPQSSWYLGQAKTPQIQREAFDRIESSVRKYATGLHETAQKENREELKKKSFEIVAKLYDAHIQSFNRDNDLPRAESGRVHYYRAEIHRGQKEWAQSGFRYDNYIRVVDLFTKEQVSKVDQKLYNEAIWSAVEVWAKAVESDKKYASQLLGAADRFLKLKPSDPRAPQVLLDASFIEAKAGNKPIALKRLNQLVVQYPRTRQAMDGVDTILDILNKENDWVNLAVQTRQYMNSIDTWALANEKTKVKDRLNKILSQTEAKACDALKEQADKKLEAALCFESFARGFEKDPQAPNALFIASGIYDDLKDPNAAVSALETLVKKYPNSSQATLGFSRLASVYEKSFSFSKAIEVYEILLNKSGAQKDREKILTRLLNLYESTGGVAKMELWLSKKDTPNSIKSDFAQRKRQNNLVELRQEEIRSGWANGDLVSSKARALVKEIETLEAKGRANVLEALELRRVRGMRLFAKGDIEKADKEWMAGLKAYWGTKDKNPSIKEAAARLRLEQGSIWESQFRRTDIMKNPGKKAELFKKVENWYAEVIEMGSPAVALDALWKTAELNIAFADSVRNSPIPAELLAPGMEGQKQTYTRLIQEKTEPLRKKSISIIEKIATKAREWKVITPSVLASLKVTAQVQAGVVLPGVMVSVDESTILNFPWAKLPRWMDLSSEQLSWKEWGASDSDLKKALNQELGRSASRRAAFVLLARNLNTNSSVQLSKWVPVFNDKAGIQIRIQTLLNLGDLNQAALFLEQYESFFGSDAFSEHFAGHLEWSRGNYSLAYLRWVRPSVSDSLKDFRSVYWAEGWAFMLDEMIEGWPSASRRKEVFARLAPLVKGGTQEMLLAKLCVESAAICNGKFSSENLPETLGQNPEGPQNWQFSDGSSGWEIRRLALAEYVKRNTPIAKDSKDFSQLRKALTNYYSLFDFSDNSGLAKREYGSLRKSVDLRQDVIDLENKQKIVTAKSQDSQPQGVQQ